MMALRLLDRFFYEIDLPTRIVFLIILCWQKMILERSIFKTSNRDSQLLHQKVPQRISVMKANNGVFVVFKTKHELKCRFSGNNSPILRFFDKLFDVIFNDPFLTL